MAAHGGSMGPLSDDESGIPNKRHKSQSAAAAAAAAEVELVGDTCTEEKQQMKTVAAAGGEGSSALPAAPTTNTPPSPKSGKTKDLSQWNQGCRRINRPAAKDPRRNLPTVVEPRGPEAADPGSVASPRDKALVREAARSIVSVSCIAPDGKVLSRCTGIVISWKETKKCARILTSSYIVFELDPKSKLHIGLPNRTVLEGQLLFFNNHYDIALLEISSESDLPLQLPSFGSNPNYDQEVFVLARGEESKLMAGHGRIMWFDEPEHLQRNHLMFLNCDSLVDGSGGPVIDHDGNVAGMTFDNGGPNATILAIFTILTCVEMWMKFSRIARPVHGLSLRTVELLELSLQEVISVDHNINNGYIIDKVSVDSTAEKLGIRYGDVIVSFDGLCVHTLPQLEDYLLSLGWRFLQGSIGSSSNLDIKLEVYDLLQRSTRRITMPVEFCDASE